MAFKEVVPGVLVNEASGIKVSIPHPDPVVIIQTKDKSSTLCAQGSREIYVFSSEGKAVRLIIAAKLEGVIMVQMTWDELVDYFQQKGSAIIDPEIESSFDSVVPLRKGI
ncbi:MAG: hypothetical protein Q7R92_02170 [bacterium]|nr:hypothetical protein [bacterium]